MIKYFLTFLLITLYITAGAQDKQTMIDSAYKCIELKNYGRAINIYNKLLSEDSTYANGYEMRGDTYREMHDYESAGRDYTYAIKYDQYNCFVFAKRADLLTELGYYDYALQDYTAALQVAQADSVKSYILVNSSMTRKRMNDFTGAEKDLRSALAYDSTSLAALANIGAVLSQNGKITEAITFLEKAIRLAPDFEGGYGNLAFLYIKSGNYKKALDISDLLVAKHPDEPYALNNRGYAKLKLHDIEGALEDINNSINLSPQNSYAFKNRGEVYLALKKNKEACADFQKALQLGFTKSYGNEVQRLVDVHCSTVKPKPAIQ